ncbi:MAG: hypothetical protein N2378_17985 [Chloroflexaceae bacterium]|nr:hypothetical protein [Chloroflexaceae bacterium]
MGQRRLPCPAALAAAMGETWFPLILRTGVGALFLTLPRLAALGAPSLSTHGGEGGGLSLIHI